MSERHVSQALDDLAAEQGLTIEHLGLTLGAVIHGVDLRAPLTEARVACIRQTLLERKVNFFREQPLSGGQLVDFSWDFGEMDVFPSVN